MMIAERTKNLAYQPLFSGMDPPVQLPVSLVMQRTDNVLSPEHNKTRARLSCQLLLLRTTNISIHNLPILPSRRHHHRAPLKMAI